MISDYKIVDFHKYCHMCKHKNNDENEEPCDECLSEAGRVDSKKPNKYVSDGSEKEK